MSSIKPNPATPTNAMARFDPFGVALQGSHLVEASAGTGKTWTLGALVQRLVLERELPLKSILVVTYTKAAAAELRARIRERLALALQALEDASRVEDASMHQLLDASRKQSGLDDEALKTRLVRALAEFDEAAILTIHAFCQRALGETAFAAQLPWTQEVQDDDQALRLSAVADHWRQHIQSQTLAPALQHQLFERNDTPAKWERLLKSAQDAPLAHPLWPEHIDAKRTDTQDGHPTSLDALQSAFDRAQALWFAERDAPEALLIQAALTKQLNGQSYTKESIGTASRLWNNYFRNQDPLGAMAWSEQAKLFTADFIDKRKNKLGVAPRHAFFEAAAELKALHATLTNSAELQRRALMRHMLDAAGPALKQAKASQRIMTFNDMLQRLHARLQTDKALALTLRQRYPAALVDEFQDTDALQLDIFRKLYQGSQAPVFFVGDPKQAIYAFRGADLHSYLQARQEAQSTATLLENHRSTAALIKALNAVFTRHKNVFGEEGLQYHPVAASTRPRATLEDTRNPSGEDLAALDVWALPAERKGQSLTVREAMAWSAEACALDIARTLAGAQRGKVKLDGKPLRGSDIAVLVETHRHGQLMREALAGVGVPSVEMSRASVFATAEAQELSNALHGVFDASRPGAARAALSTELIGLDAAALAAMMVDTGTLSADQATEPNATTIDAQAVLERMLAWRTVWTTRGVAAMVSRIVDDTALAERMLPRRDGERRMTNWLHLMELLNDAEQTLHTPKAVLRWFDQQLGNATEGEATQLRLASDQHLVQIVTVHRAKGLEFPIVYLPLLWSNNTKISMPLGVTYHDSEGRHVIDYRTHLGDDQAKVRDATVRARLLHEKKTEQLRLIYVALTRASQRCVLVIDPQTRKSSGKNSYASLKSMLNWVVAGDGHTLDGWSKVDKDTCDHRSQSIEAAWQSVQAAAGADMALNAVEDESQSSFMLQGQPAGEIDCLASPGPVLPAWRMGSFSAWLRSAPAGNEGIGDDEPLVQALEADTFDLPMNASDTALDSDVAAAEAASGDQPPSQAAHTVHDDAAQVQDILHFPRGPSAGDSIHALLERADFSQPGTWPRAARMALQLHPQGGERQDELTSMLSGMLQHLSTTPLLPGLMLKDIGKQQRLNELEFDMTIERLDLNVLVAALRKLGMRVPALSPTVLRERFHGHLRGFIDMVFEHQGRYYLLDWKSNHLGDTPAHYFATGMEQAMVAHGYHLQHVIYAMALRRHLLRTLGAQQAAASYGGAFVVFVRGARPHWLQPDGRAAGVVHKRLDDEVLLALDGLLKGNKAEAAA